MPQPIIISHWYTLIENFSYSPQEFYKQVRQSLETRQIPKAEIVSSTGKEGGVLSASREYLRVQRNEFHFDICASPFGTGFFVSWWLCEKPPSNCLTYLVILGTCGFGLVFLPLLHRSRLTYYQLDTALMFQEAVRRAVLEIIDSITQAKGLRALSEEDRKPIMREFFRR